MPTVSSAGPAPYTGQFGRAQAFHLLRRTTYAVRPERVLEATSMGLAGTINRLMEDFDPLSEPINAIAKDDPNVPIGTSWVKAPLSKRRDLNAYRVNSLLAWVVRSAYRSDFNVKSKMMMFWHNHFACEQDGDMRPYYQYLKLLRDNSLGNVRQLMKDISVDVTMLVFLDNNLNKASAPNENYARELLELYTVGKGEAAGPGDYTTFTEQDVRALARAFTGWEIRYRGSDVWGQLPDATFTVDRHDYGDKKLSQRLGGVTIRGRGPAEVDDVIDAIFAQRAPALHLSRKLYRWFLYHEIDDRVEREIIEPMADLMIASNYEIEPVVRALLGSAHFYEEQFRGAMVKNPLDFIIEMTRGLGFELPSDLEDEEWFLRRLADICELQDMDLVKPPSVAGWEAYHQAPLYNRVWATATTLQSRYASVEEFTGQGFIHDFTIFTSDLLAYIAQFDNPTDPNELVAEMAERLLPQALNSAQRAALKEVLIPGLPDFEWTVEYNSFLRNQGSVERRASVERKVRDLVLAMFATAEAHLS